MKYQSTAIIILLLMSALIIGIIGYQSAQAGSDEFVYLPVVVTDNSNPPPPSDQTLTNGGHIDWPDGGGIAAFTDTLSASIEVAIMSVSAPLYDLPEDTELVGSYYEVSANADTAVSTSSPFVIAFPIPNNVNMDHLGLAVLLPVESYLDSDPQEDFDWHFLEGQVDAANQLFITTLPFLAQDGRVFVLISHPQLDSPPNNLAALANRPADSDSAPFSVNCIGFNLFQDCTEATEEQVEGLLSDIHTVFDSLGYPEPRLKNLVGDLDYPPSSGSLASLGYSVYIEPINRGRCGRLDAIGVYVVETAYMIICPPDPSIPITASDERVLVHEYFHALEFGFTAVLNEQTGNWIIEGMAKSVEESYFTPNNEMTRSENGGWESLHPVDVGLRNSRNNWLSDLMSYFAQDFWVYIGQLTYADMGYLKEILQEGANTDAVETALPALGFPLDDMYWRWAKNQFMEKNIDFDGALGNPCYFDQPIVDPNTIIYWNNNSPFNHASGTIAPLNSFVVQFNWEEDWDVSYLTFWETYKESDPQLPLEYKIYEEGEACQIGIPDGRRRMENVNNQKTYYILLSNTSTTDTQPFLLFVD